MRCAVAASTILLMIVSASPLLANATFPYVATVRHMDAPVRSGPSNDFYETDRLPVGTEVEVYRHDGDGWCAIRPPRGSFSWVSAKYLEQAENEETGRIIKTPVKTRVGSHLDDIHDVEYISLRHGEVVRLLGSARLADETGQLRNWFRIAPPAGEFRWVHAAHLQRPLDATSPAADAPATISGSDPDVGLASVADAEQVVGSGAITTHPLSEQNTSAKAENAEVPVASTSIASASHEAPAVDAREFTDTSSTWRAVTQAEDILIAPEPQSFQQRLGALNLLLSQTVLAAVAEWDLQPVLEQTALLAEEAATPTERWEATALLEKARQFQDLQRRKLSLAIDGRQVTYSEPAPLPDFSPDASLAPAPEMPQLPASREVAAVNVPSGLQEPKAPYDSIFDATGLLVSVVSGRPEMPRYALTNEDGKILRFVAPDHTLNVNNYLNKRVGIIGETGYLRRFKKPFLAARKIVTLQQ